MVGFCQTVSHIEGSFMIVNGVKKSAENSFEGRRSFWNRGTGYGEIKEKSQIFVYVNLSNHSYSFEIGGFFKHNLGPLTKKRVEAIKKAMPLEIKIEKTDDERCPFRIEGPELDDWLVRVKQLL